MRVKLSEFRAAKPGVPGMWGSAAWAQTQLTPGVSVPRRPPLQTCLPVQEQDPGADAKRGKAS
jgi:hypothetical protein